MHHAAVNTVDIAQSHQQLAHTRRVPQGSSPAVFSAPILGSSLRSKPRLRRVVQRVTKRALAEPFLVPSPNAGVLEASFDLPTVDCEVLGQVGELLGRLYRSCLRAWITDASTAHLAATDEADTVTAPLFAAAKQAETAATESGLRRDTKAARVARRKAEKAWRDTYRDSFYEFEKVWMRDRKRALTTEVSSRQAGTIVRAAKKQRELSLGNLDQLLKRDTVEIALIQRRLALQVRSTSRSKRPDRPSKSRRVKGYADKHERRQKQRRLQILGTRLADTTSRIAAQKPKVCVGTAKLLKQRHNLEAAGLTEQQWQQRWNAARMIVGGTGETGKPFGNDTIRVMPTASVVGEYMVMVRLPKDLEHLSNTRGPQAMYQLDARIVWDSRNRISGSRATKTGEWHQRIIDNQAVAYRLALDVDTGRWSLTASWTRNKKPRRNTNEQTPSATPVQSVAEVAYGRRCCGIDLNAGHFNAFILDKHGNPQGAPIVYEIPQQGTSKQRQTRVCEALHSLARDHLLPADINHVAVEQLDFADIAAPRTQQDHCDQDVETFADVACVPVRVLEGLVEVVEFV